MRKKRKPMRSRTNKVKTNKWIILLCVIIAIVFMGYLTVRFVIGPIIGYNTDYSDIKESEKETGKEKEASSKTKSNIDEGYSLQFGAFSTEEKANSLQKELKEKGIETEVKEIDGKYKVLSSILDEKEKALDALDDIEEKNIEDVFITSNI